MMVWGICDCTPRPYGVAEPCLHSWTLPSADVCYIADKAATPLRNYRRRIEHRPVCMLRLVNWLWRRCGNVQHCHLLSS
jgi:hypothetical protein